MAEHLHNEIREIQKIILSHDDKIENINQELSESDLTLSELTTYTAALLHLSKEKFNSGLEHFYQGLFSSLFPDWYPAVPAYGFVGPLEAIEERLFIPAGTDFSAETKNGECRLTTLYDAELLPITLSGIANVTNVDKRLSGFCLSFSNQVGGAWSQNELLFYLCGPNRNAVFNLLSLNLSFVEVELPSGERIELDKSSLFFKGLSEKPLSERLKPQGRKVSIIEYFAFHDCAYLLSLRNLDSRLSESESFKITFWASVDASAVPLVTPSDLYINPMMLANLFMHRCELIQFDPKQNEYDLVISHDESPDYGLVKLLRLLSLSELSGVPDVNEAVDRHALEAKGGRFLYQEVLEDGRAKVILIQRPEAEALENAEGDFFEPQALCTNLENHRHLTLKTPVYLKDRYLSNHSFGFLPGSLNGRVELFKREAGGHALLSLLQKIRSEVSLEENSLGKNLLEILTHLHQLGSEVAQEYRNLIKEVQVKKAVEVQYIERRPCYMYGYHVIVKLLYDRNSSSMLCGEFLNQLISHYNNLHTFSRLTLVDYYSGNVLKTFDSRFLL